MRRLGSILVGALALLLLVGVPGPAGTAVAATPVPDPVPALCVNAAHCIVPAPAVSSTAHTAIAAPKQADPPRAGSPCEDDPTAVCGTTAVPRDYADRSAGTIAISWRLLRGSTDPSLPTIDLIYGGPGQATIASGLNELDYLLGGAAATRDVLLVDQRGRGTSEAIDCEPYQRNIALMEYRAAIERCAKQLGPRVDDYATANNAKDMERVRAELGIARFDLIGFSYGAMDALAYAARFGSHVASIIMGSGAGPATQHFTSRLADLSSQARATQRGLCAVSKRCTAALGDPLDDLRWAAKALDAHPLTGMAKDAFGTTRSVTVTSATLSHATTFGSVGRTAWVAGAASAYRHGDPAPLLRLGAFDMPTADGSGDDPTDFSSGAFLATYCTDYQDTAWPDGRTYAQRRAIALRAAFAQPASALAPLTPLAYVPAIPEDSIEGSIGACTAWPDTHVEAPIPAGSRMPDVPVLAIVGGYDGIIPPSETIADASRFRQKQVVTIPTALHVAAYFDCGPERMQQFLDGYQHVAKSCEQPASDWFVEPGFPKTAAATSTTTVARTAGDRSTAHDRQVAEAAWLGLFDGWVTTFERQAFVTSDGLRGGTATDGYDDAQYWIDFDHYALARDVGVTGRLSTPLTGEPATPVTGTFAVSCGGATLGTLTVSTDLALARDGKVVISGTLGGRPIRLTTSSL